MNPLPGTRDRPMPEAPFRPYPSKVFVETSTRCNLACPMCVKQSGMVNEGLLDPVLFAQLRPAFSHLDALILNGIGEPLLHPELEAFIAVGRQEMPSSGWVGFQTNGLLIDDARAARLVASGVDKVCVSVDSIDPAAYRRMRTGGELERVEQGLAALLKAKKNRAPSRLELGIEFVVMRDNLHELPGIVRWAGSHGATFMIVTHLLPYHHCSVTQTLFDANTDDAVALFTLWKEKAASQNIDIHQYPSIYLKYGKTPAAWKIFDLVEAMKAEAFSKGIFLHLDSLFKRGDERAAQVREVFDEARQTAERLGIEIRLPEAIPRSRRSCEFVEEGGAFVSQNGDVHPCYFLWHGYQCHIDGREKQVGPRVLGSLREEPLLAIWNSATSSNFRTNVMKYDYPYCFNCGFALCDYVQGADFQQDCYVNTEPCGACLWCMGVFQCLR